MTLDRLSNALMVAAVLMAGIVQAAPAAAGEHEPVGGIGVRLVDAPTARRDDPRAEFYVVDHVSPGTTIGRRVEVSNTTGRPQPVDVYAGPAKVGDGRFVGVQRGEESELTQWISLSESALEVPSGGEEIVTVSIDVPEDVSEGERYGVIWASVVSEGDGNVQMVNRVGIRVYLSVGPGGEPASDFEISTLTAARTDDGLPVVQAEVENTGGRAIDMSGELTLSDGPGSLSAGPFPAELGTTLAPGDTAPVSVVLDARLPDGPWHAALTLKSGTIDKKVEADITFPEPGETATSVMVEDPWRQRWTVIAGVGVVVLLALGVLPLVRQRRRGESERDDEPVLVG